MSRNNISVPFGHEPQEEKQKGTLIYYDTFEDTTDVQLDLAVQSMEQYSFDKLVLYPLHEETVRRMMKGPVSAFHKREKRLFEWKHDRGYTKTVSVEGWEGKRKKYTPMDSALRLLSEKYKAPYFLYITPEMANLIASFSSFDEWIVKIRLLLTHAPHDVHPKLEEYQHRWGCIVSP
ncbi:hypothetical protein [Paenibacillus antarcticus]|uniref:Uncharacterized protein n=1 Tax=Paenibacillus antarcticus TaxID=253703 RepID=A0A168KX95_9BACL|nr:hypothetical protein [Paenibacillus antarcticus]OAB42580.1 hypothetical protein PBAT_20000 [Paenibacillus antarcticus]